MKNKTPRNFRLSDEAIADMESIKQAYGITADTQAIEIALKLKAGNAIQQRLSEIDAERTALLKLLPQP